MIKKLLLFSLHLISVSFAQKAVQHSINVFVAPEYQHWTYFTGSPYPFPNNMINEFAVSTGFNYKISFKQKYYLLMGIEYNYSAPGMRVTDMPSTVDLNKSSYSIQQNILGFGLKSGFIFVNKEKFTFGMELGVNLRYVVSLNYTQRIVYSDGSPDYTTSGDFDSQPGITVGKFLVEPLIGFPFHYKFNTKWSVFANPYFAMSALPMVKANAFYVAYNVHPLRAGVQIGGEISF